MPRTRRITPWNPTPEVFADEFHRRGAYTNWRPKGSGDCLLIYTVGGAGRFTSAEGPHDTQPGEVVLYLPEDAQDYANAGGRDGWRLLWAHFTPRPHWQRLLQWRVGAHGVRGVVLPEGEVREGCEGALRRVVQLGRRRFPNAPDLAANALEEALIWAGIARGQDASLEMDARVRRAVEYLDGAVRDFDLGTLARHCGLSVSRLAYLFKEATGLAPMQFWERARLQRASQLLRLTGLTVTEVAGEVGFDDAFYFSNRFRRFAGMSPSEFRKSVSGGAGEPGG